MKSTPDPITTPDEKMERFRNALRDVVHTSKSDLDRMVADAEKIRRQSKKKPGPKPSASGHASDTAL